MKLISIVLMFSLITFLIIILNQDATAKNHLSINKHHNYRKLNTDYQHVHHKHHNNHKKDKAHHKHKKYGKNHKHLNKESLPIELEAAKKVCNFEHPRLTLTSRIINGSMVTSPYAYPWIVALYIDKTFKIGSKTYQKTSFTCGGSLISASFVLTAAHCLLDPTKNYTLITKNSKSFVVRLGTKDLSSKKYHERRLSRFWIHPNSSITDKHNYNDIALFRLATPVNFNDLIKPICVPYLTTPYKFKPYTAGHPIVLTGWGKVTEGKDASAVTSLRHGIAVIVNKRQCVKSFSPQFFLPQSTMCENEIKNLLSVTCQGDSGGPTVPLDRVTKRPIPVLIGIVSFGGSTCKGLSVDTKVEAFHWWIKDVISKFKNS